MKQSLESGMKAERILTVKKSMTIHVKGTGYVYSTPSMINHMERVSQKIMDSYLDKGEASVGFKVDITHLAATPLGMEITTRSTLLKVQGRRCLFAVEAFDKKEKIGEGLHERVIIDLVKFASKVASKRSTIESRPPVECL